MSDVDGVRLQLNEVEQRRSSVRQTPLMSFGERFKTGLRTGVGVVAGVAESAGYHIPAAAVLGASMTGMATVKDAGGSTGNALATNDFGSSTGFGTSGELPGGGGAMNAVAGYAAGGDKQSQLMMATQRMQEMNQQFNLQYLQLQQGMQNESRQFTAVSNIMKTKHDTARNALSNLK